MARQILGVDLDNVIARTDPLVRQLIRDRFGIDLRQDDIREFAYSNCGITEDQERQVFEMFHGRACLGVSVVEGAQDSLSVLSKDFEIHVVTSRPRETRDLTVQWLDEARIPYDRLDFMRDKTGASHWATMIDDRRETIYDLAELGVRGLLWNYPWNQPVEGSTGDPTNVQRITSWGEIVETLLFA